MANGIKIKVNGLTHGVQASLDTPLLYVLHNELHLHGPRFGCGLAQCGACSVLLDGKEIRSCVTPVAAVSGKSITTLEGLPALYAAQRGTTAAAPALHPLQQAWIDVQVPHCGYCQNGMMIQAADLLATTKNPSEDQIRTAMNGHLCRCGTYPRILTAIQKAAAVSGKSITTLEGLPALYAAQRGTTAAAPALHPLQQAWIDVQVPHCGYCQNGMMIQAADLLATTKNPSEDQIRTAMNGHLCRCGTYPRILTAIQKAAAVMAKGGA